MAGVNDDAPEQFAPSLSELTRLALAADPDQPLADDAVPFVLPRVEGLLPDWYMPVPVRASGWRARTLGLVILAIVGANAIGLCVTYGFPEIGLHLP